MGEVKDWMWLVKTNQGDFFITVVGKWTQAEAAAKVRIVFDDIKLGIIGMIPRKRATGPDDCTGTIVEQLEPKDAQGFDFMAGKKLWHICGRAAEYDAEMILLKKGMEGSRDGHRA